ncbi:hypothetical protein KKF34_02325 [Myxococcota bacterium]|nr:hypothetical protein [Myxococcota bacterium]MBU1381321.1 hypothetical protein [Myxococcota bacterium]MBU1495698.1 hypothetical protein [Myxococcota bacterium]
MEIKTLKSLTKKNSKAGVLAELKTLGFSVVDGVYIAPVDLPDLAGVYNWLIKNIPPPWIVRSSFENEDSNRGSFAGCFNTVYPVWDECNFGKAVHSVLEIPEKAFIYGGIKGIVPGQGAVIVQSYIDFAVKGVAFYDCRNGDFSQSTGKNDSVTSGTGGETDNLYHEKIHGLCVDVSSVLEYRTLDLEFGIDNTGRIYILQVRELQDILPYFMNDGEWRLDKKYNPLEISPFHASLIRLMNNMGFHGVSVWKNHIYVPGKSSSFENSDIKHLTQDIDNVVHPVQLFEFCRFAIDYLSRSNSGSVKYGGNIISWKLKEISRELNTQDEEVIVRNFVESEESLLPFTWDVASPVLRDFPDKIKEFCSFVNYNEPSIFPENEKDDVSFAREMYKVRHSILERGKDLSSRGLIDNIEDIFRVPWETAFSPIFEPYLKKIIQIKSSENDVSASIPVLFENGRAFYNSFQFNDLQCSGKTVVPGKATGVLKFYLPGHNSWVGNIVAAEDFTPQDIISLAGCAGLLIKSGTLHSHGAILARELGIPAMHLDFESSGITEGRLYCLDAGAGKLYSLEQG